MLSLIILVSGLIGAFAGWHLSRAIQCSDMIRVLQTNATEEWRRGYRAGLEGRWNRFAPDLDGSVSDLTGENIEPVWPNRI